jgi:hypothetical protein
MASARNPSMSARYALLDEVKKVSQGLPRLKAAAAQSLLLAKSTDVFGKQSKVHKALEMASTQSLPAYGLAWDGAFDGVHQT